MESRFATVGTWPWIVERKDKVLSDYNSAQGEKNEKCEYWTSLVKGGPAR